MPSFCCWLEAVLMTVMRLWRDLLSSNKFAVCYQDLFKGIFSLKEVFLILSQIHLNIAPTKLFTSNKKTRRQLQDNAGLPVFYPKALQWNCLLYSSLQLNQLLTKTHPKRWHLGGNYQGLRIQRCPWDKWCYLGFHHDTSITHRIFAQGQADYKRKNCYWLWHLSPNCNVTAERWTSRYWSPWISPKN